jgi:Zn-dependent protease
MELLMALGNLFWTSAPRVSDFLMVLSMVIGGLNAFNLMPFWPLDGGRIVRVLTYTFVPRATQGVTLAMSALAGALAIWTQSYFLFFFVLLGLSSLFQTGQIIHMQRGMTRWQGVIGLAAYLTTTLSFCWVAFPLLAFFR